MIFPIMRIRDLTIDDFYANIDMFDKYNGRNTYALEMSEKYAKSRVAQSLAKCFFSIYYSHKLSLRQKSFLSRGIDYSDFRLGVLRYESEYRELYSLLNDDKSRYTLLCLLAYRLTGDFTLLHQESDFLFKQYFDNILHLSDREVFVDCGGYVGDVTEKFIGRVPDFKKIYFYEPELSNYSKAVDYFSEWDADVLDKLILRNCGVGRENTTLRFASNADSSHVSDMGDTTVNVVSLDNDIEEPISFLKMDIEGFEIPALHGAQEHLSTETPKLAICVYHLPNDLWEIPQLITEINSNYKLYLRQYNAGILPIESVIYAL